MRTENLQIGMVFTTREETYKVVRAARNHIIAEGMFSDKSVFFPFGIDVEPVDQETIEEEKSGNTKDCERAGC